MNDFDIIVLGSGIAGSILALVLQQAGIRTLVVERKSHPRFVIGESTVPTTSFLLSQLATEYGVPELAEITHYLGLRDNGCAAWAKQGFWYGVHREGERLAEHHETMFDTLLLPNGPDVHMLRADADGFLVTKFPKYGVEYLDNTELIDYSSGPSGVKVRLQNAGGERDVTASLVVDATGHASFFANRFGLRDEDAQLATNTRSLFAHFEGVPPLDELLGGFNASFRFRRDASTMHHCFPGGWIWVIPFDSGITSVGFQLDREMYPLDESITPEQEIERILARFPTIRAHLGAMKPVRPLIRTGRIQFTAKSILGPGCILAPHAAGFIEPLYSSGVLLTASFISRFVPAVLEAKRDGDFGTERFRFIEQAFLTEVDQIDKLVNGTIQSYRDYDLFKQYWRNWIIGTVNQFSTCILAGRAPKRPVLYGSGIEGFRRHVSEMHDLVRMRSKDDATLAAEIRERTEPWWEKLTQPVLWTSADFSLHSPTATGVHGGKARDHVVTWLQNVAREVGPMEPEVDFAHAERWLARTGQKMEAQIARYQRSRDEGSDYHRAYERILANANPARFDYHAAMGITS